MGHLLTVLTGCLFLAGPMVSADDNKKDNDQPFDDAAFVQKAASGGMHEIALGKIAEIKAKNPQVKAFAERMVSDHGKLAEQLTKAAKSAGVNVPKEMNEQHLKEVERFHTYSGIDFDGDYVKHMISDHEKDEALFTRASKEAKNPAIKEFAKNALPIIQDHLATAKKIKLSE